MDTQTESTNNTIRAPKPHQANTMINDGSQNTVSHQSTELKKKKKIEILKGT